MKLKLTNFSSNTSWRSLEEIFLLSEVNLFWALDFILFLPFYSIISSLQQSFPLQISFHYCLFLSIYILAPISRIWRNKNIKPKSSSSYFLSLYQQSFWNKYSTFIALIFSCSVCSLFNSLHSNFHLIILLKLLLPQWPMNSWCLNLINLMLF